MSDDATVMKRQHALLLKAMANRLEGEFGNCFTRDTLQHYVDDSYEQLVQRSKVLTHIPAFVERFARKRLEALAKAKGCIDGHKVDVLFVCERNDALSQMAAALFNVAAHDQAFAHSAGTNPAAELLEEAVHVLHEIDLDLVEAFPKPISAEIEGVADVIVTLDAHDDIAILDGKRYQAWRLVDRRDEGLDGYRAMRDELRQKVLVLVAEVVPPLVPTTHKVFDRELAALQTRVDGMGHAVVEQFRLITDALARPDPGLPNRIIAADDSIDAAYLEIETKVVELIARRQPAAGDLRTVIALLQTSTHLERIADGAVGIAETLASGVLPPEGSAAVPLAEMAATVVAMTETALQALAERDVERALAVENMDEALNRLDGSRIDEMVASVRNGNGVGELIATDRIAGILERAGEHGVDIAEGVWFLVTGEFREFGERGLLATSST